MKVSVSENPLKPGTFRVHLNTGRAASFEAFLEWASTSSTLSRADVVAVTQAMADWVVMQAEQGREAQMGPLGRTRLGMRGVLHDDFEPIRDEQVEMRMSWVFPSPIRERVRAAGADLARKRVERAPVAPEVQEVRTLVGSGGSELIKDVYLPGALMRVQGARLDADPSAPDEGFFLQDRETGEERKVAAIPSTSREVILSAPPDAAGSQRLIVRRRHPRGHGRLWSSTYEHLLLPFPQAEVVGTG